MVLLPVHCPCCQSDREVKGGKSKRRQQRYVGQNQACAHRSFRSEYGYQGRLPQVKPLIIERALNGSGIRDTARVLELSPNTVLKELKKKSRLESVNPVRLERLPVEVQVLRVEAAELDEMGSFVGKNAPRRGLWHALAHHSPGC